MFRDEESCNVQLFTLKNNNKTLINFNTYSSWYESFFWNCGEVTKVTCNNIVFNAADAISQFTQLLCAQDHKNLSLVRNEKKYKKEINIKSSKMKQFKFEMYSTYTTSVSINFLLTWRVVCHKKALMLQFQHQLIWKLSFSMTMATNQVFFIYFLV